MIEETGITREQLSSIVFLIRESENGLLRSSTTTQKIDRQCRNAGLSAKKTSAILAVLDKERDSRGQRLVFSNTQDSLLMLHEIRQQNALLLDSVGEILDQLKMMPSQHNDHDHYQ